MKCFYHGDQDGIVSGYYVKKACKKRRVKFTRDDFREINYGVTFPLKEIQQDELVFIVDYSIDPEEMWQLLTITRNVFWIDHHQTAIDKYKDFKCPIKGIRLTGKGISGANLTWWYFEHKCDKNWHGDVIDDYEKPTGGYYLSNFFLKRMIKKCPLLAKYTANWDTFNFEEEEREIVAFRYAFGGGNYNPCDKKLKHVENQVAHLVKQGMLIFEHEENRTKSYVKSYGFETTFEGRKAYAVNSAQLNSFFFSSIDPTKYDIFIGFCYKGDVNRWVYQLYSAEKDKVNVAKLAEKYGGGGHSNAAGFSSDKYELGK